MKNNIRYLFRMILWIFLYLLEDENTVEGNFYLGTYVGSHNRPFGTKLGILDSIDGNTELHDRRVEFQSRSGK